jgi:DNA-binding transcriptional ArsR family regulator
MNRTPSTELFARIADRLKALADPTRLRILHFLEHDEHRVSDVLAAVGGSQGNVSKHLALMRRSGLLASRREGTSIFYRVADQTAFDICRMVCDVLEQRADAERTLLATRGAPPAGSPRRRSARPPGKGAPR